MILGNDDDSRPGSLSIDRLIVRIAQVDVSNRKCGDGEILA